MTLDKMKDYCFKLQKISTVEIFDQVFKKEGYVEIEFAAWRSDEASCLLLNLKDGVVPIYFKGEDKKLLSIREIKLDEFQSLEAFLGYTEHDIKTLNSWLEKEYIKPWCSVIELFNAFVTAEPIYEDMAYKHEPYAYSYPDEFGSGYLLFPLVETTYICPFKYHKPGYGHVYNPDHLRILDEGDQVLIQAILAYQIKIEKILKDLVHQKRLMALLRSDVSF
jgi:hypothetical protein